MKFGLKIISIALIMLTGTGNAFAGPWGRQREAQPRAMRQPRINQQEQRQQRQPPAMPMQQQLQQPQQPQQQGHGNLNPNSNPMMGPNAGGQFPERPTEARNPGQRMSVEERQRLRRQINEAGQDIYTQKR